MSMQEKIAQAFELLEQQVFVLEKDPQIGNAVIGKLNALGPELRIWVDTANAFGHHATTMNILKRMVQYGFSKPIRVFCDASNAAKLQLFLPGYTAGDKDLQYQGVQLIFHYDEDTPPSTAAPLLLCGGSEAKEDELKTRLDKANCQYYLQLQPWNWKSLDRLIYKPTAQDPAKSVTLNGQQLLGGPAFSFCAFNEPAPKRDDTIWDAYARLYANRVAIAKILSDAIIANPNQYHVLPEYGLGTKSSAFAALLTLMLGTLQAQILMPQRGLTSRPVLLVVFDVFDNAEWKELQAWLDGSSTDEDYPDQLKDYVTQNGIAARCIFSVSDDPSKVQQDLAGLNGNKVMAVKMSSCPDEIFRYFYASATLPYAFEGRGTQNLALNLRLPYMCTGPEGYPSFFLNNQTPPPAAAAERLTGTIREGAFRYKKPSAEFPSTRFAGLLCDLLKDQVAMTYFEVLSSVYGSGNNDKLRMALRFLRSIKGFPA